MHRMARNTSMFLILLHKKKLRETFGKAGGRWKIFRKEVDKREGLQYIQHQERQRRRRRILCAVFSFIRELCAHMKEQCSAGCIPISSVKIFWTAMVPYG